MPDVAIIGEKTFLFEKLFQDLGLKYQFIKPGILGSPFLPQFRMVIIPTGFANPQYSQTLPALKVCKSNIANFVKRGGVLTVFSPLVSEHSYEWLPLQLKYIEDYRSTELSQASDDACSCLINASSVECDGYLVPGEKFETVLVDSQGRAILVRGRFGDGTVVVTTIHEFPSANYLCWVAKEGRPAKI
ncbi:MAG: hypothetical protein ACXQT4_03750 [Methanotrichaceae archaeon]